MSLSSMLPGKSAAWTLQWVCGFYFQLNSFPVVDAFGILFLCNLYEPLYLGCVFLFCFVLFFLLVLKWPTFWDIHGVQAAQQVSDKQVVSLLPAQPVAAGEIVAQMWPVHVGHHHPVQEPAGAHPCVVVLDPGENQQS